MKIFIYSRGAWWRYLKPTFMNSVTYFMDEDFDEPKIWRWLNIGWLQENSK